MDLIVGKIVSLQVGQAQTMITRRGREWTSAIRKEPVTGPVALGRSQLSGDQQVNRKYHGGPDKAVCVYAAEHYPHWRATLDLALPFGAFGENFTVAGIPEDCMCIGDTYAVGSGVEVQVSQPRQPCINLARRWDRPDLPTAMQDTGWTGVYLRVLREGEVSSDDTLTLIARPHPGWTILRVNRLLYGQDTADRDALEAARCLDALARPTKRALTRLLSR